MIFGEGAERSALEALVREYHLEADVALPGFVADIHRYMARAGVFALSSSREGLPTVLIEALALGVPVVATDCPSGPREILRDGKLGRLVPPDDDAALAEGICAALDGVGVAVPPSELREFTFDAAADAYLRLVGAEGH
jgi:glycosyltransferase involved in cell wall biosynthesis